MKVLVYPLKIGIIPPPDKIPRLDYGGIENKEDYSYRKSNKSLHPPKVEYQRRWG